MGNVTSKFKTTSAKNATANKPSTDVNKDNDNNQSTMFKINKRPKDDNSDDNISPNTAINILNDGNDKKDNSDDNNDPFNTDNDDDYAFGWIPDDIDDRDYVHIFDLQLNSDLYNKSFADLSVKYPIEIYNQRTLGSCVANSIAYLFHYDQYKQNELNKWKPSRLFIYYNGRSHKNKLKNVGCSARKVIKSMCKSKYGVCSENDWAYDVTKFAIKPPDNCYIIAKNNTVIEYAHVRREIDQLKAAICDGYPVKFGFHVFPSFLSPQTAESGNVIIPTTDEVNKYISDKTEPPGHALVIVGYDDSKNVFKIRNSWGTNKGDQGYYYFPYDFLTHKVKIWKHGKMHNWHLCWDIWIIKKIEMKIS